MKNKKGVIAISQVMILLFGIIAISYAVGSGVGVVRAVNLEPYLGKNIQVTLNNGESAVGILTKSGNSNFPYALKDSSGKIIDFVDTEKGTNQYLKDDIVSQISTVNSLRDSPNTPSTAVNPASGGSGLHPIDRHLIEDPGPNADETPSSGHSWYAEKGITISKGEDTHYINYKGFEKKSYFKENDQWYSQDKGGGNIKVANDKEIKILNGKGVDEKGNPITTSTGEGAGLMEAGQYFTAGMILATGVKAIIIAAGGGEEDKKAVAVGEGLEKGIQAGTIVNTMMKLQNKDYGGKAGTYVGIAVAVWYIINHYKDLEDKTITFECSVWEAPRGGLKCSKCNNEIFGCSEYQCRSLGKGCELLNPGSDEELCTWINRNDDTAAKITPWNAVLNEDFKYTEDDAQSPPDRGVIIHLADDDTDEQGCIKAYTPLKFGVSLDEPATCKIDVERKNSYEEMSYYFGSNSLMRYNHSHTMMLPSIDATGPVIKEGTNMSLFVRCEDANENSNLADFVFKFCVEVGDDFTPPLIVETRIPNNKPVAYNISNISLTAYINEPAECNWDFTDKKFELMDYNFSCSANPIPQNAQMVYECETDLTGIKDRKENKFYFRCNDSSGNINKESQPKTGFILKGTQPLYIDWAKPNGIIKGSTSLVQVMFEVKTSSGANNGDAFCYYQPLGDSNYVQFKYDPVERTYQHTQELSFNKGPYIYSIKCIDAGGNAAFEEINFEVEVDKNPPLVIRAYEEDGYLKLITDEAGECVYNTLEDIGCRYEFDDGIEMQTVSENEHFVEWNSQETFYIKCKDMLDIPEPFESCSIIARPAKGLVL